MLNRTFTFCMDDERGFQGLRPDWMSNADPSDGLGCMHDMLEHFKTQTSALEGECEALGAFLYLRLENGWMSSRRAIHLTDWTMLGTSLTTCLIDAVVDELDLPTFIRTIPLPRKSELALQNALDEAFRRASAELVDRGDEGGSERINSPLVRQAFAAWVRRGYRRAVARFSGIDTYSVSDVMFPRVGKALDKLMSADVLVEGDAVGVSLNLRELTFFVRVNGYPANELYNL